MIQLLGIILLTTSCETALKSLFSSKRRTNKEAHQLGLVPLVHVRGFASAGVDPKIMGALAERQNAKFAARDSPSEVVLGSCKIRVGCLFGLAIVGLV